MIFTSVSARGETIVYEDGKRYLWILSLLLPFVPIISYGIYFLSGSTAATLIPVLFVFGLIPLLDAALGEDFNNPPAEVIAALKAEGITMSAPYLSQLRSGNRTNPSAATMAALANFFRIKPAYFTDDEYFEKLDQELTWLADMRDEGVRRIAARTVGLSAQSKDDLVARAEELRRQEHLDS